MFTRSLRHLSNRKSIARKHHNATTTARNVSTSSDYDAIVVGGGHNGLVAATYLAKSGLKRVCVLERRHVVGGAAITEEIVKGFKFSRASYLLSLLRPAIMRELELERHGLKVYRREPSSFTPILGEKASLTLGGDAEENRRQIARFSERDADRYEEYERVLNGYADLIDPLLDLSPSELADLLGSGTSVMERLRRLSELSGAIKKVGKAAKKVDLAGLYELITAPSKKVTKQVN